MRMGSRFIVAGTALGLALAGCGSSTDSGGGQATGLIRVVQAVGRAPSVAVRVDGNLLLTLAAGTVSAPTAVAAGQHTLTLTPTGGGVLASTHDLQVTEGASLTLVARDSAGIVVPALLGDTGAIVPAGKSKLRVMHAAALAPPLSILRKQPDFPDFVIVMFPFAYGAVSPYIQSDPGTWQVLVTAENQPDTLHLSGALTVADGKRVTVIVMDSSAAGGVTSIVVADN
jgi:hypothetical protein